MEIVKIAGGEIERNIRESYFGGISEIYNPTVGLALNYLPIGAKCWYYDVNSLYPYIMKKREMPMGGVEHQKFVKPDQVDIRNYFGFYLVKVIAPKKAYLLLPVGIEESQLTPSGT